MASISQPVIQTVIQTTNGECKVKIELEINVNLNKNELSVAASTAKEVEKKEVEKDDIWAIPDFENSDTFEFGKIEQ